MKQRRTQDLSWLPIDSRLVPHLFAFGHVKGLARIFLGVEMILSVLVVVSTLLFAAVTILLK